MKISIADKNSDHSALAKLFSSNLTPEYISHSELQGYRAIKRGEWAKNIDSIVHDEIVARLHDPLRELPTSRSWRGVIEAHDDNALVGVALVTTCYEAATPYGIIEDIVVDRSIRGKGHGGMIMQWILDRFRQAGIKRAFLESGGGNERAHHLFEKIGFTTLSVVMMKDL